MPSCMKPPHKGEGEGERNETRKRNESGDRGIGQRGPEVLPTLGEHAGTIGIAATSGENKSEERERGERLGRNWRGWCLFNGERYNNLICH
jgi:hypothetical protein